MADWTSAALNNRDERSGHLSVGHGFLIGQSASRLLAFARGAIYGTRAGTSGR